MTVIVRPAKRLRGELTPPGDKSITHRAMLIGAISEGTTEVVGFSAAADPMSTLGCLRALGVEATTSENTLHIHGRGLWSLSPSRDSLDAGNSGTTIRLLTGILAAQRFDSILTGDQSLQQRPMKRIIDPLQQMGARIEGSKRHTAPLRIFAVEELHGIDYELPVPSAQVKSAILLAGLFAKGKTRIKENTPTRDHTERMLNLRASPFNGSRIIEVEGPARLVAQKIRVPGDLSAATFFIVAGSLVPNSEIQIKGVGLNPTRTAIIDLLRRMGAEINIDFQKSSDGEPAGDLTVRSSTLTNVRIGPESIPAIIDELPAIAVAGALAKGEFQIRGASELRAKESDRIRSLCENLKKLSVSVEEFDDGFAFDGENQFIPMGLLNSYGDHRIAMAMGIAGLLAEKNVEISDADCVDISYPGFWDTLKSLGS